MTIEWGALATILAPILALFVGVWINRKFENRPILTTYYGHISGFRATPPERDPIQINTHAVVLRNTGRKSATNVRVHHHYLPDFSIWPSVQYHTENLPDGSRDIVIPTVVPGEEITISYLYFPPTTAANVNAGIKCDQGFANPIPVMLQRQYPAWITRTLGAFVIIGVVALIYSAYTLVKYLMANGA